MKTYIISLAMLVIFIPNVQSDIHVYSDKDTKEVVFIVENDKVVLSSEDSVKLEETVLPNNIEFYNLTEEYSDYKLSGKKLILNTRKISDRENEKDSDKNKSDKKDTDFDSAKEKLIILGLTSDEVESLK